MAELLHDPLVLSADAFAEEAHRRQTRRDGVTPYITHPRRVAAMVAAHPMADVDMVAAALLHDVVEDCGVTVQEVETRFGVAVAALVESLTNPSKGLWAPRAKRKAIDRRHLAGCSREVQVIKLCDRLDNLRETDGSDLRFARIYACESRLLVEWIAHADVALAHMAMREIIRLESLSGKIPEKIPAR